MLLELADYEHLWGPLRLFRYLTLRAAFAGVTAMIIGFVLGPWLFAQLRRLRAKQAFRTRDEVGDLAELHASKAQTPTMGLDDFRVRVGQLDSLGRLECLCGHRIDRVYRPDDYWLSR